MSKYSMDIQKLFPALFILPLLNAQTVNIYRSNQTYSGIVCPGSSLGIETQIFTETQCARCCREDPSCVAFHYSDLDRKCYFYSMAVFGAISEGTCVSASGFLFYVEGNVHFLLIPTNMYFLNINLYFFNLISIVWLSYTCTCICGLWNSYVYGT